MINETLGHFAGDELLRQFAGHSRALLSAQDVFARLGGDEFVVMMAASREQSRIAMRRLQEMAAEEVCAIRRQLSWSVGGVSFDEERHTSVGSMLEEADSLMYQDKLQRRRTGS